VLLEIDENGLTKRLLFTGDLGQPNLPIVRDPTPMPEADILMIESTYGDRLHPAVEDIQNQLEDIVKRVVSRGGRIIIPAFAVGRTQEIVYDLHQLCYTDRIPEISIFVDSPLALNVTEVFRLHADCYDAETRSFILDSGDQDPFGFYRLKYVRSVAESKKLNVTPNPIIIISASGMAEAGRVQHHLKHAITDPRNAVLITGWQAPHTLGRRIAEKQEYVNIYGESYPLRAEVHTLYGYSAHADRDDLLDWSRPRASTTQTAFVVHGDPEQSHALALGMEENGYQSVVIPQRGDIVNV
jgi:metallo-beta-lactamase family protein